MLEHSLENEMECVPIRSFSRASLSSPPITPWKPECQGTGNDTGEHVIDYFDKKKMKWKKSKLEDEWKNEWMSEWIIIYKWISKWMNEWINRQNNAR